VGRGLGVRVGVGDGEAVGEAVGDGETVVVRVGGEVEVSVGGGMVGVGEVAAKLPQAVRLSVNEISNHPAQRDLIGEDHSIERMKDEL
jgi:hypothetical protein